MKQHITPKQLQELSEPAKARLRDWWKPEQGDYYTDGFFKAFMNYEIYHIFTAGSTPAPAPFLPLLSIGQMIEFLDEHDELLYCEEISHHITWEEDEELCDTLWEAVKTVLETPSD